MYKTYQKIDDLSHLFDNNIIIRNLIKTKPPNACTIFYVNEFSSINLEKKTTP